MNNPKKYTLGAVSILIVFILSQFIFKRIDFTADQKYSLSEATKQMATKIESPLDIRIYLHGDFPLSFKKLENETSYLLEEFQELNPKIHFEFIDPYASNEEERLLKLGLNPTVLNMEEEGEFKQKKIFPWALIQYKDRIEKVPLLIGGGGLAAEQQINASIENLEYVLTNHIALISKDKKPKVGIITHHFELAPLYFQGFMEAVKDYVKIEPFVPEETISLSKKDIQNLSSYDALIIAKPSVKFTDKDRLVLDQYIMNGGKTFWMIDAITAEMDSLYTNGKTIAIAKDLNLTDMLFSYGVRVNPVLVKDKQAAPIKLATGKIGNNIQYNNFPWVYYPLVFSKNNHPINKNIDPVRLLFPNQIDTLAVKGIKKTVLLSSSPRSEIQPAMSFIDLSSVSNPQKEPFHKPSQIMGVLLEGPFTSAFKNRVKEFKYPAYKEQGIFNKMIVIADGDLASNEVQDGKPFPMGYDKWVGRQYGNNDFVLNSLNYLLDDNNISLLRSKDYSLRLLDGEKSLKDKRFYQLINLILPLLIIGLIGLSSHFYRKRKYAKKF